MNIKLLTEVCFLTPAQNKDFEWIPMILLVSVCMLLVRIGQRTQLYPDTSRGVFLGGVLHFNVVGLVNLK